MPEILFWGYLYMGKVIALSGTHGTGKTTNAYILCAEAKKLGINTVVLDERARECPFPINEEATNDTQAWLILSHAKKELELIRSYDLVISDRSILDPYVYGLSLNIKGPYTSLLTYCVSHVLAHYESLYLLDKDAFSYCVDDGVRAMSTEFRDKVHQVFLDVLGNSGIDYKLVTDYTSLLDDLRGYSYNAGQD